jgi:hypothetical protein
VGGRLGQYGTAPAGHYGREQDDSGRSRLRRLLCISAGVLVANASNWTLSATLRKEDRPEIGTGDEGGREIEA